MQLLYLSKSLNFTEKSISLLTLKVNADSLMNSAGFFKFIFYWRMIALQNFAVFYQTSTWISHRYTYNPSLLSLSQPDLFAPCHSSLPGALQITYRRPSFATILVTYCCITSYPRSNGLKQQLFHCNLRFSFLAGGL